MTPARPIANRLLGALLPFALLAVAACTSPAPAEQAPSGTPTLVLVSFDGFRWDYATLTETPNLDRLARRGLRAQALIPVFPTLTFPNHFSIATGVWPWRHGIVANRFPNDEGDSWYSLSDRTSVEDGRWYQAEPIWVTAEKAGLRTAAYYFVGTEADIQGVRPGDWRSFDKEVPGRARVDQVLDWLQRPTDRRPHLVTLYFEHVDDNSHWYGPGSPESLRAIRQVDDWLGRLLDGIETLPQSDDVYVLVVSDHGQGTYASRDALVLDQRVDIDGAAVVNGGAYAFVHLDGDRARAAAMRDSINRDWDCGRAYLPEDLPAAWNAGNSPRYPELVVQPDPGCGVITRASDSHRLLPGDHGWPPDHPDMWGIFYAAGPRIPAGTVTGPVRVVDVHPLMLAILGLEAPGATDGDPRVLASRLLPESE
jgi:predicted AlkP superfamily pyrophosphatase or phosphodiesterase